MPTFKNLCIAYALALILCIPIGLLLGNLAIGIAMACGAGYGIALALQQAGDKNDKQ